MKSIFLKMLTYCLIVSGFTPVFVFGQVNKGYDQRSLLLNKARELYTSGQFSAANAYITANWGKIEDLDFKTGELSDLRLMMLVSGIIANETHSVKQGRALLESTEERSVAIKLAYHLGHYYFNLSMYPESIALLEKTDPLYLGTEEQERVQFEKGVGYFSMKRFDNARPFLRSLLQQKKSLYHDDAAYYMGFIDFSEKKFQDAAQWFMMIKDHPRYISAVPFYLAFIDYHAGNVEGAIRFGEQYLKSGESIHTREMQQLLASLYFNRASYALCSGLYEKLIASGHSLNPTQRFELGTAYYHQFKYTKALEQLKPLTTGNDRISGESTYILANCYLQLNEKNNARSAFQLVLSGKSTREQQAVAKFHFSKLSLETGYEDQGLQGLSKFLVDEPSSPYASECREILVGHYARTNNFRQALQLIESAGVPEKTLVQLAPRIYFGRGIELVNDLQYEEADKYFAQLFKYRSSDLYPASLFWRGELAFRKEDYTSCINHLTALIKIDNGNQKELNISHAWYNLGYAYFELEDYLKAGPWFEKVYAVGSRADQEMKAESMLRAADCAFMEKKVDRAKSLYSNVQRSNGYGSDYASFQLAIIEGIKSPSGKISLLRSAEQKYAASPYIPLITAELADTYMAEEQFDLAIPYLKRIPTLVDKDDEMVPESLLKLGIAYFNLDRLNEAVEQYQQLVREYPATNQAKEALENARILYVESAKIDAYESFLNNAGLTLGGIQKDSLSYQVVQRALAEDNTQQSLSALDGYINAFPDGLFIAEALNAKADLLIKDRNWKAVVSTYEALIRKGSSKYQEKALRQAGKINFFELKDYVAALRIFQQLSSLTSKAEVQMESLRGEVRCHYYLKSWKEGKPVAARMLEIGNATPDDLAFAHLVMGYAAATDHSHAEAIIHFSTVTSLNKALLAAEARYQIALAHFNSNSLATAEKAAAEAIELSGSYEFWITRSYLLLGEIFIQQKDYFNAKATFKSILDNCSISALKQEAGTRLAFAEQLERGGQKSN